MTRKLSIAVIAVALAVALLMSGTLVGVSYGGGGGITQPTVIELSTPLCIRGSSPHCRGSSVRWDLWGRGAGIIAASQDPVFDIDDNRVGILKHRCVDWVCTDLLKLVDGQFTDRGTVVITGYFHPGDPSTWAVTGGTGAYENVRGFARMVSERVKKRHSLTLTLIP
jgi:hypothetical protein